MIEWWCHHPNSQCTGIVCMCKQSKIVQCQNITDGHVIKVKIHLMIDILRIDLIILFCILPV
jgi:hypothetical protein